MSATTSVRIMSGLMITHKIGVLKSTRKTGEIGGAKRGDFGGSEERAKMGGTGWSKEGRRGVKKFLRDKRGVGSGTD